MKITILFRVPAILPVALAAASSLPTYPDHRVPLPVSVSNQSSATTEGPAPSFTYDELFQLQKKFLDEFIYPENQVQVLLSALRQKPLPRTSPSSLFSHVAHTPAEKLTADM